MYIVVRFLWNLNFLNRFSKKKHSNIGFDVIPSGGSRGVPCGRTDRQTDRHDEAKSRCSQFCERAQKQYFASENRTLHLLSFSVAYWWAASGIHRAVCVWRPLVKNIWTSLLSVTSFTVSLRAGYVIQQCNSAWFYSRVFRKVMYL